MTVAYLTTHHDRDRYYNPSLGRFISEDPIGFEGKDNNLYRYTRNNPIILTDPSGEIASIFRKAICRGINIEDDAGDLSEIAGLLAEKKALKQERETILRRKLQINRQIKSLQQQERDNTCIDNQQKIDRLIKEADLLFGRDQVLSKLMRKNFEEIRSLARMEIFELIAGTTPIGIIFSCSQFR